MEIIILAGGRGSRLKDVWDRPKCLAPIHDRPFLDYLLKSLVMRGATRFIISIGYKKNLIKEAYKNSEYKITWSEEDLPLGTGGAVKLALEKTINRNVFIVNGDTLFLVDLHEMMQCHRKSLFFLTAAIKQYDQFTLLNGGITIINTAIRTHLKNNTSFEDLFKDHKPNIYLSQEYFRDIGSPHTYALAQEEFLKFE